MMKNNPHYQRYLWSIGLLLSCGIAAVLVFIVTVDPYGLYGLVARPGFNSVKPGLSRYHEDIKVAHAKAIRPVAVIAGNSRAEIGFDPQTLSRLAGGVPVYNLAIPGVTMGVSVSEIEALHKADIKPQTVVLGTEFLDFVVKRDVVPSSTGLPLRDSLLYPLHWRLDVLFSLQTLSDTIDTLRIQRDNEATTMSPQGFNPLLEYNGLTRKEGYFVIFEQRAREYAKVFLHQMKPELRADRMADLDHMLKITGEAGSDLRIVIYPYHAQILTMFERAGLWPVFEQWKDQVLVRVATARQAYPKASFKVIDFSGYNAYSCEQIPGPGDTKSRTKWYWEAGHFKKELGDLMLEKIMAGVSDNAQEDAMPGIWLEPGQTSHTQRRFKEGMVRCQQGNAALFMHVDDIIRQVN